MTTAALLSDVLARQIGFLKMHLNDFSDAQFFARPVPNANHAMWQIGHLISAEARMCAAFSGTPAPLPEGFAERFKKDKASFDEPAAFPSREDLLSTFDSVHAVLVAAVAQATDTQLAADAPETVRAMAPTLGHLAILASGHIGMHIGQIQVIRRSLGLPVLF